MTVTWKMANTQTNPNPSTNYDYSQYAGYQYETGSYNTTVPVTTATTAPAYNYGYDYSQAGYSGYNTYSGQYGYGQGYDYSNYPGYYTTTSTTPTVQSAVSTGAVIASGETQVSASSSYGSSGSTLNPPPVPTVPTTSNSSTWGGYYNTVQNTSTGGYSQPQTDYGTTQSSSSAPSQIQSTAGSQQSWNQQGYGSQTNVAEGAGNIQTYQTQTPTYGSQSQNSQYQGDYRKQGYNTVDYDNSSQNTTCSYYSGVQNTTGYNNEPKSFSNSRGWGDRGRNSFNKNESRGATYGSNGRGAYNDQNKSDRKDPCDEYDARNYRDNSMNRNDRGQGGGRGRGYFSRGRGNQGSGFPGLKGQWSDDSNRDKTYGQRSTNNDNRGGRGSFRGSGRGRGNVFNSDKLGYDMDNNVYRPDSDSGKRGGGYGGRGGYGRGDNHDRNRGGFRGGYDGGRGQSRGGFSRAGGRGERGRAHRGQSQLLQESGVGRGRGSVSGSLDSKETLDGEPNVANDLPWTNTTAPSAELKRKQEPLVTIAAKKKKEEEIVDVMPFIQAHIEEHCTVNEDARKLAEESLKKMMQPGYCVLCNARMSGTPQAKMHYQGKNHNKKIKNFITGGMTKYAEKVKEDANKTEEQLEKERMEEEERNRLLDQQVEEGARRVRENLLHLSSVEAHNIPDMETRPSSTGNQTSIVDTQNPDFCHLCTVEFSSAQQAEQHYQGKNHKKRLKHIGPGAEELGQFVCETCNVRVTTQEILNQHFNGAKHKAKASREVESKDYIVPEGGLVVEGGTRLRPGFVKGRGGNSNVGGDRPPKPRANIDYSNFRTPSGKYYCPMCDVTMNTEAHFAQHSQSRTHRQKNLDKKYQDLNEKN